MDFFISEIIIWSIIDVEEMAEHKGTIPTFLISWLRFESCVFQNVIFSGSYPWFPGVASDECERSKHQINMFGNRRKLSVLSIFFPKPGFRCQHQQPKMFRWKNCSADSRYKKKIPRTAFLSDCPWYRLTPSSQNSNSGNSAGPEMGREGFLWPLFPLNVIVFRRIIKSPPP